MAHTPDAETDYVCVGFSAQSANIDSMIPIDLSPIKKQPGKKTTGLFNSFLSGPPTKASFF